MNPTNFSGLFGGGRRSLSKDDGLASGNGGDAEMVTPLGQRRVGLEIRNFSFGSKFVDLMQG